MYSLAIIGAGATGLGLLLLLEEEGSIPLEDIVIIDPNFLGGDLVTQWGCVQSNTLWQKTVDALQATCPSLSLSHLQRRVQDFSKSCPLSTLGLELQHLAGSALNRVAKVQTRATRAEYSSANKTWSITLERGVTLHSKGVVFAQGAIPKTLDIGIPSIPLPIALDPRCLKGVVNQGDRVLVFGTMHSGTLVLKNLLEDCSANVVAVYNSPQPFTWDRDGAYDGLKREAAEIADRIIRGDWSRSLKLVTPLQTDELLRFGKVADWVIYAMGFAAREDIGLFVDGCSKSVKLYNGSTGAIMEAPSAWGFGVAYPNRAPDGVHWDVSVAAFLVHMKRQLSTIVQEFKRSTIERG